MPNPSHTPKPPSAKNCACGLHPPPLFTKQVPDDRGDMVHGYYLPPGTEVDQSVMGVGRDPTIFGNTEDANIFRPERWLEADPERFKQMASAVDLVFSTGKYVCQGKPVALMELAKLFVEVCWTRSLCPVLPYLVHGN